MSFCDPICDFCTHYDFNPVKSGPRKGAYQGKGRCEHPAHPRPADPADGCEDFKCGICCKEHA